MIPESALFGTWTPVTRKRRTSPIRRALIFRCAVSRWFTHRPKSFQVLPTHMARQPRRDIAQPKRRTGSNIAPPVLLTNIRQLLTLRSATSGPRRGGDLADLAIIEDATVLCAGGKIVSVGKTKDATRDRWLKNNRRIIREIDCTGKVVLPGFVDSHTHPAFVGPRLIDFERRISGATYEDIAAAGGGIRSSLEAVR